MEDRLPDAIPRVIFLDAAGTLFELRESVGAGYARLALPFRPHLDPGAADAAFRAAWKSMPPPHPSTAADPERDWWRRLVRQVLSLLESPLPEAEFQAYFEQLWTHYGEADTWELFPEVPGVLEALSSRYRLAIISNFDQRLYPVLDGLGIRPFFESVTLSAEVRASKPAPEIFAHALEQMDCQPGEALHVGDDRKADWEGAEQAHLMAWRLQRPENSLLELSKALMR